MTNQGTNKIGLLGLGAMGSALADALLSRGFSLTVWNRDPQKSAKYADAGASVAESVESVALQSDVLVVCLTDYQASMEVLDTDSVTSELSGKTLVILSTMSPEESASVDEWAANHGIGYLAGSILGYPEHVRAQQCKIVYSGSKVLFDSCTAVLAAMGGIPQLVGEKPGMAMIYDKAVYAAYYAHCLGIFQGAAICEAAGIPLESYIENFTGYWDWSVEDALFLDMIKSRDYPQIDARMQIHAAAFAHVAPLSRKLGVDASLADVISNCFDRALERGLEDSELPALFEVLRN
jgi:3-hydroxyisobutyrate dehydrogenase-like beta-hydroxyacid dehydrogenase